MQTLQAADLIGELLKLMLERNSSDLFINAGCPPAIKVDGEMAKRSPDQLSPEHTAALVRAVMSERQLGELETTIEFVHLHKNCMVTQREVTGIKDAMKKAATRACKLSTWALFEAFEAEAISDDDALRNADSVNDLRLQIKLHSQRSKSRDLTAGTKNLLTF